MKALVTGGGGFLGRYIVERLVQRGDEVSIFCRGAYPEIEQMGVAVIRGDLRDENSVGEACQGMEMVFHVASMIDMWGKASDFRAVNIDGTRNVLDACQKAGVSRLIHTSTASVVFSSKDMENVDESVPYSKKFLSAYPASKAVADRMVLEANGEKGVTTTAMRPHLIWGPRDPSLLPKITEAAKAGKLPIIGSGKSKVDLTYVDNVADAHILAAESPRVGGQAYFIGQEEPVVLWEFLNELFRRQDLPQVTRKVPYPLMYALAGFLEGMAKITGKAPLITRFLAAEFAKSHYFSSAKAKEELGYQPSVSMKEGMDRYIAYLKNKG